MSTIGKSISAAIAEAVFSRRALLVGGLGCVVAACTRGAGAAAPVASSLSATVTIENFSAAGVSLGTAEVERVNKPDEEWRKLLSGRSYQVTRHEGTEPAFSGEYTDNHADGLYRCICCDTALYDSRTKFESGTGWPSYWQPNSRQNVVEKKDRSFGMARVAINCARCDGHLGHVFDDGPPPTGLRYCMNSVALKFVKKA
jgi:peptide-methionine (R)-S-oxide reductase